MLLKVLAATFAFLSIWSVLGAFFYELVPGIFQTFLRVVIGPGSDLLIGLGVSTWTGPVDFDHNFRSGVTTWFLSSLLLTVVLRAATIKWSRVRAS